MAGAAYSRAMVTISLILTQNKLPLCKQRDIKPEFRNNPTKTF